MQDHSSIQDRSRIQSRSSIHFIGIGGYGMSSLAKIFLEMGWDVSGSDVKDSRRLRELKELGARVTVGHNTANLDMPDLVAVSVAVPQDNVEVAEAERLGIPIVSRAELLGQLMKERRSIAVTGSHGKTTTTSMISAVLIQAGLDPTIVVGAEIGGLGIGGRLGKSNYLVAEADEAYGSFLKMYPTIAVVTNIDDDHLDYYGTMDNLVNAFRTFLSALPQDGLAVLCADCERVLAAASGIAMRRVTYGLRHGSDVLAVNISISGKGSTFDVERLGTVIGRVSLHVPGRHNICNALACVAVAQELGIDWEATVLALERFRGAERRCQVIADVNGILIMDDYAHHPTEIAVTLEALKDSTNRRIVAVFQPQRYTRTQLLMREFAGAFSKADLIFITEIYHEGTGESPIPGVSGSRLAEAVREHESRPVEFVPDISSLAGRLVEVLEPGDLVVTMGAGDIWKLAYQLADILRKK